MKYIESIITKDWELQSKLRKRMELGDLTIIIGQSNSGKTRILNYINTKAKLIRDTLRFSIIKEPKFLDVKISKKFNKEIKSELIPANRPIVSRLNDTEKFWSQAKTVIKDLDNNITEISSKSINIKEQGSGIHSALQTMKTMYKENTDIVLIDEPETSLFPAGKITLLSKIIDLLEHKQVVIATHDPTFINKHLISQMDKENKFDIKIYSCSQGKFNQLNMIDGNLSPDIQAGFLTQTFSGKPVHLYVEGHTDFYVFQALLTKYCISRNISDFVNIINKIAIYQLNGSQWINHIGHLPDIKYYKTITILDNEYESKVRHLSKDTFNNIIETGDLIKSKHNIGTFLSGAIEDVFSKYLGKRPKKPYEMATNIWKMSNREFNKINFNESDDLILVELILKQVIAWAKEY